MLPDYNSFSVAVVLEDDVNSRCILKVAGQRYLLFSPILRFRLGIWRKLRNQKHPLGWLPIIHVNRRPSRSGTWYWRFPITCFFSLDTLHHPSRSAVTEVIHALAKHNGLKVVSIGYTDRLANR